MMTRCLALACVLFTCAAHGDDPPPAKGTFARFVGVCQAGATDEPIWRHLSWVRTEPFWGWFQPSGPDEWNQQRLEEYGQSVLDNRAKGVTVLPCLDYMQPWAARRRAWRFTVGDKRYDVAAFDGDIGKRQVTVTHLGTGAQEQTTFSTGRVPPEDVGHWEYYVRRVVAFLSQPPYDVRYFQIWNEANDAFTGFWTGGMDEYMTTIHLPAARIIRERGARVVFGGYPCNGSMAHFLDVLDRHEAWDTLDVLDIHYFPLSSWQVLFDAAAARGRDVAIWQTEIGFTSSKSWVPNCYPRFFHWSLSHDWRPERYVIFQFAHWSPDDPKAYGFGRCFMRGRDYTHHGQAFVTLGALLEAPVVKPFDAWRTRPPLGTEIDENRSSAEGFHCGDRIVLAFHLVDQNGAAIFTDWQATRDNMHLEWDNSFLDVRLPGLTPDAVAGATRVGVYGSRRPLSVAPADDEAGIRVMVPTADTDDTERRDNRETKMHTFYLEVVSRGG